MKKTIKLTLIEAEALRAVFRREVDAVRTLQHAEAAVEAAKERREAVTNEILDGMGLDPDTALRIPLDGAMPSEEIEIEVEESGEKMEEETHAEEG